jgi:hypothetical protein
LKNAPLLHLHFVDESLKNAKSVSLKSGQVLQFGCPKASEYVPLGHKLQLELPSLFVLNPFSHGKHLVEPKCALNVPFSHGKQLTLPTLSV